MTAAGPPTTEYKQLASGLRAIGERLDKMEKAFNPDVLTYQLKHLTEQQAENYQRLAGAIGDVQTAVDKINSRVATNASAVATADKRLTLLETFCTEQVKPALSTVADQKTQIAVMAAKYGAIGLGAGGGVGLIIWVLSALTGQPLPSP